MYPSRSSVDRLIALAGVTKVDSYKRTTKSGKVVDVQSYMRKVGDLNNNELFQQYQALTSQQGAKRVPKQQAEGMPTADAVKNRVNEILGEIRKRQEDGSWGHSNQSAKTQAANKVDRQKGAEQRGRTESRARFEANKENPQPKLERVLTYETPERDAEGNPIRKPAKDDEGKEIETPEYREYVDRLTGIIDDILSDPVKIKKYDTQVKHGIFAEVEGKDGKTERKFVAYTPERTEQHKKIIQDILNAHLHVPKDRQALMSGGLGGAGKGTVLGNHPSINEDDYLVIDPDKMKEEILRRGMGPDIPDLLPMEQAAFIHEESSDLANMLQQIALAQGMNIILDTTMAAKDDKGEKSSADGKIEKFLENGYEVKGIFVDVPVEVSIASALGRHLGGVNKFNAGDDSRGGDLGGRYVPPSYIEKSRPPEGSEFNSTNRMVFERLKKQGKFSAFELWDTSDRTKPPQLVESGAGGKTSPDDPSKTTASAIEALKKKTGSDTSTVAASRSSAIDRLRNLTTVR